MVNMNMNTMKGLLLNFMKKQDRLIAVFLLIIDLFTLNDLISQNGDLNAK